VAESNLAAEHAAALPEYRLKAAFLCQFFHFVRWPETSPQQHLATSRIGILGEDPFDEVFKPVEGTLIEGRPLEVRRFHNLKGMEPCHILFISASEDAHLAEVLTALRGSSTLTVSEAAQFTRIGGIVRFYPKGDRIGLEINAGAAERAGLKLSAKLLDLAKVVADEERKAAPRR
jgi:hypothetical protein